VFTSILALIAAARADEIQCRNATADTCSLVCPASSTVVKYAEYDTIDFYCKAEAGHLVGDYVSFFKDGRFAGGAQRNAAGDMHGRWIRLTPAGEVRYDCLFDAGAPTSSSGPEAWQWCQAPSKGPQPAPR
jgi:hypothetical protein